MHLLLKQVHLHSCVGAKQERQSRQQERDLRARSSTSRSSSRHLQSLSPQRCRTSRSTASLRTAVTTADLQQRQPCTKSTYTSDDDLTNAAAAAAAASAFANTLAISQLSTGTDHSENTAPAVCDDGRAACTICSRRFALDRIAKHQTVCATLCTSESVRGVFDSSKQRLAGLDECSLLSSCSSSSRLQYKSRSYSPPPLRGAMRANHSNTSSQTSYSNTTGSSGSSNSFMQHGAADAQCFSGSSSAVFSSGTSMLPAWNEQFNGRTARQRCQTSLGYSSSSTSSGISNSSIGSGTVRAMIGSHSAVRLPNPW
jgi:zinc-finger of a C2HC-type